MHNYWAAMFVLPKGVLNRVDAICRNFLWEGNTEYNKTPSVGCHKVCVPKREWGLGLHQSYSWNMAMVGKLVWWLFSQLDRLWVQWVNHIYLKNSTWLDYKPTSDVTWYWKKVYSVKETIKEGFLDGQWCIGVGNYTVRSCYEWVREKRAQVHWYRSVWCPLAAPKHSFIVCIIVYQGLMLKDRLKSFQVCADDLCCIYMQCSETQKHLFSESDLTQMNSLEPFTRRRWSRIKKSMATAALLACWYAIWFQRNSARLTLSVDKSENVAKQI
ncbi:uncharacterized protein LOC141590339 [Silene latifolia]|uniref:uncharacterized protein LOC141590339 n=1 Tax=Silene latifolia TaxID=37657 RepID=UPI003D77BDA2